MTPRSLFIIILKVMGLWVLIDVLKVVPTMLETVAIISHGSGLNGILFWLGPVIGIVIVYYIVINHLLFKPHVVIDKLGLEKNFDEETFELKIHSSTAIKIGVIFVAGCIFLQNFVPLITNLYVFIRTRTEGDVIDLYAHKRVNYMELVNGSILCLLAYYIISNVRYITNLIEGIKRKDQKPVEAEEKDLE